jgi:hypothetical protein
VIDDRECRRRGLLEAVEHQRKEAPKKDGSLVPIEPRLITGKLSTWCNASRATRVC